METAYWRIKTKAQILAAVRKMSMNSPLYSFAKKWSPSSPHENYVINQNPPTPPDPCIDRNQFSIVPPLHSFCDNCPSSSPPENPVINQNPPPPPDPCIDRNQFSIVPPLYSFGDNCPPPLPQKTISYTKILRPPSPKAISYDSCLTPMFMSPNVLHQNRMKTMKRSKIHHPMVYIILRQ